MITAWVHIKGPNFWAKKKFNFEAKPQIGEQIIFGGEEVVGGDPPGTKIERVVHLWDTEKFLLFFTREIVTLHVEISFSQEITWRNPFPLADLQYQVEGKVGQWFVRDKWEVHKVNKEK